MPLTKRRRLSRTLAPPEHRRPRSDRTIVRGRPVPKTRHTLRPAEGEAMSIQSFRTVLVVVATALLLVPIARGGAAVTVVGTGVSPFAGCTADLPDLQPGELVPNVEVEPFLAVNPTNPHNLVGVWQQDRWTTLSSRG